MDSLITNFSSPIVLCFILGALSGFCKSTLEIPQSFIKAISVYLMLSIGFQGGVKLVETGLSLQVTLSILTGICFSFLIPFLAYRVLKYSTRLSDADCVAVSAHYGSISIITFAAAMEFLKCRGVYFEDFLVAVAAIMETPAILSALILHERLKTSHQKPHFIVRQIFLHGSVFLLFGGVIIGALCGSEGMASVKPFFSDLFKGILCLFLLDIGITVAKRFKDVKELRWNVFFFALYFPVLCAGLGILCGHLFLNLSMGGSTILGVLCASASYIAVPAAMREIVPQANPAIYVALSIAITFPFNIFFGIPTYYKMAEFMHQVLH